ncbi:MAG: hypothetical protein J0H81_06680 [Sphingopyxis terrae]|nr:hypothetical protein [Sphingopyxis terrae]
MSRFAGLPAALKATKATMEAPEDIEETEDDGDGTPPPAKSKQKEPVMADENQSAALDAAKKECHDAGFKAATDRFNAGMAREHWPMTCARSSRTCRRSSAPRSASRSSAKPRKMAAARK